MSSTFNSQSSAQEKSCPKCGTKNAAANEFCTSCKAPLDAPNITAGSTPSDSSGKSNVLGGLIVLGVTAYGLWKALRNSAPEPPPKAIEIPVPPKQVDIVPPRTQTPPEPAQRQPSAQTQPAQYAKKSLRPRPVPGEHVEGMVEGLIGFYRIPGQPGGEVEKFEVNIMQPFYVGTIPIYPEHKVQYSSPTPATFVFAFVIDTYPSGPLTDEEWTTLTVADLDILWESQRFVDHMSSENDTPQETPEYRKSIDDCVQRAQSAGWEPAGHGRTWFGYRFRKRYDEVPPLKWK